MPKVVICPKCGEKGILYEQEKASNTYYVVAHYNPVIKKVYLHYIGPSDYIYVSQLHSFKLHGMIVDDRMLKYAKNVIEHLIAKLNELENKISEAREAGEDYSKLEESRRRIEETLRDIMRQLREKFKS